MLTPPIGTATWTYAKGMTVSPATVESIKTRAKLAALERLIERGELAVTLSYGTTENGLEVLTANVQEVLHA